MAEIDLLGGLGLGVANSAIQFGTQMFAANQQRDWALKDRAHEEEYNSMDAQMQRMRNAGANPNLAYGGNISTGTATPPNMGGVNPDFGSGIAASQAVRAGDETVKNLQAQNSLINAQRDQSEASKTLTNAQAQIIEKNMERIDKFEEETGIRLPYGDESFSGRFITGIDAANKALKDKGKIEDAGDSRNIFKKAKDTDWQKVWEDYKNKYMSGGEKSD